MCGLCPRPVPGVTQRCPHPFLLPCLASPAASSPWRVGVGVNLPPPGCWGWDPCSPGWTGGLSRCPTAPGHRCHSGRIREAEGSRVLRDTHQSTPNTRSSSCPLQTHKTGLKTPTPVLPWDTASLGHAPTRDPCPWSTASMLHCESPVAADVGFSFPLNHLI